MSLSEPKPSLFYAPPSDRRNTNARRLLQKGYVTATAAKNHRK
jgi:hypothetical protein